MAKKKKSKKSKTPSKKTIEDKVILSEELLKKDTIELPKAALFKFKSHLIPIGLICLLSFGLYIKSLSYDYVLDDLLVITENNFTKSGFSGIWDIFTTDSFQGYFGEQKNLVMGARYRPLSLVSFAVEHQFFGLNKEVSHFINILLYALCCLLIYRVLVYIIPKREDDLFPLLSAGFIIALLFTVHPLHVEAVANIKGRDEIMAMIGSMGALYFALKYQDRQKVVYLIGLAFAFYFGLFSKESSLTFLAVIPVALYIRSGRLDKRTWVPFLSLLALTLIYLLIRYQIIGYLYDSTTNPDDLMNNPFVEMNGAQKWATIIYTTGLYIKLCLFPHPLTHDYYPYHIPIMEWTNPKVILSMLSILVLMAGSILGLIKRSWMWFGIIFFFLTLSIVSNVFVNVGTFMNERFAFMPSLGILIFVVLGAAKLTDKFKLNRSLMIGLMGIITIGFSVKSWLRIPAWKDGYSLNSTGIEVSKNSARLNSFMSTAIYQRAQNINNRHEKYTEVQRGVAYAKKAIDIYPKYQNGYLMLAGLSAEVFKIDGELDKFLVDLKSVAIVRPGLPFITEYCQYLNGRSNIDTQRLLDFYYELGYQELLNRKNNPQWAIHYLKMGRSLYPSSQKINLALADAYSAIGDNRNAQIHREYGTN